MESGKKGSLRVYPLDEMVSRNLANKGAVLMECVDLLEDNEQGGSGTGSLPGANTNLGIGRAPP